MEYSEHINLLIKKAHLPSDGEQYLTTALQKILPEFEPEIAAMVTRFYDSGFKIDAISEKRDFISQCSGVDPLTVNFIFFAAASKRMLEDYLKEGICEQIFWDTILDLRCKLLECRAYKGVYGIFTEHWYTLFYPLKLFRLGRLEFEKTVYPSDRKEYRFMDAVIKPGDFVLSVHIPSGEPLLKELRIKSYKSAFDFFKKERAGGLLKCICHSWLLYPDNKKIFPNNLNIVDFMNDFDITESFDTKFTECWRLFSCDYDGNPDNLPQNTTQQRAMVKWLRQGGKVGVGFGVLIFDGERIINRP